MQALGIDKSITCFEALCSAYGERHRHYHTAAHIEAMLRHFDETSGLAQYPHETELAIWFHDAVYKPLSASNEADSARWARTFLLDHGYNTTGAHRVYQLIMATGHQGEVKTKDEQLIVDIDLCILGAPKPIYDAFEVNVRQEYHLIPGFIYRKKRKALLQSFLTRDFIYHLDCFRNKYEQSARNNLQHTIESL